MNDIFISYDSTDRPVAQRFADALEAHGWSVWWDREIPLGKAFDQVIEEELNGARCVIVLWSKESIRSRWVKTEAAAAADRECLVPILIDDIPIPFEFKRIQTAMLTHWRGDAQDPEFKRLLEAVGRFVMQPPPRAPSETVHVKRRPAKWQPARNWIIASAVILVLVAGAFMMKSSRFKTAELAPQRPTQAPTDPAAKALPAEASAPSNPRTTPARAPRGAFSIKIGDRIDDGVPGPGAGTIERPYNQDVYVFNAAPKQRVYFRMQRHSTGLGYIKWKLTDADGMEVFDTCLGCSEPGVQTLTKGGTYTLTIGNDKDPATGTYQLQLFNVPPPDQFSVKIGDVIKENMPGSGAGVIESPGAEDIYALTATARQRVYFRMWEHSNGLSYIKWRLVDENGMELFNTCLGCSEPGAQTLTKGGGYTLIIGNPRDPSTGTYRLQLYNVPPANQFSIKIGEQIRPGVPAAGAGIIEGPGAEDVYSFNATPGQKVFFRVLERDKGMDYIKWRLVDDNGTEIFNTCLACSEPGAQTLSRGGTYTLVVGNPTNPATGNYAFQTGVR